jgi:hypothetical protein
MFVQLSMYLSRQTVAHKKGTHRHARTGRGNPLPLPLFLLPREVYDKDQEGSTLIHSNSKKKRKKGLCCLRTM